jgi:excinuclease UvrABC nuclease subunit
MKEDAATLPNSGGVYLILNNICIFYGQYIPVMKEDAATLPNSEGVYLILNNKCIFYGQ